MMTTIRKSIYEMMPPVMMMYAMGRINHHDRWPSSRTRKRRWGPPGGSQRARWPNANRNRRKVARVLVAIKMHPETAWTHRFGEWYNINGTSHAKAKKNDLEATNTPNVECNRKEKNQENLPNGGWNVLAQVRNVHWSKKHVVRRLFRTNKTKVHMNDKYLKSSTETKMKKQNSELKRSKVRSKLQE